MPHPQASDPRTADPQYPAFEPYPLPERAPWWVVGQTLLISALVLITQLGLFTVFIVQLIADPQWWGYILPILDAGVIVACVASIVYWAKRR